MAATPAIKNAREEMERVVKKELTDSARSASSRIASLHQNPAPQFRLYFWRIGSNDFRPRKPSVAVRYSGFRFVLRKNWRCSDHRGRGQSVGNMVASFIRCD